MAAGLALARWAVALAHLGPEVIAGVAVAALLAGLLHRELRGLPRSLWALWRACSEHKARIEAERSEQAAAVEAEVLRRRAKIAALDDELTRVRAAGDRLEQEERVIRAAIAYMRDCGMIYPDIPGDLDALEIANRSGEDLEVVFSGLDRMRSWPAYRP